MLLIFLVGYFICRNNKHGFIEAIEICENPVIDAVSRTEPAASEDIFLYSGEKFYRFNVENKILSEPNVIKDYWKDVDTPLTAAEFLHRGEQEDSYMLFAKQSKLWMYTLPNVSLGEQILEAWEDLNPDGVEVKADTTMEFHGLMYSRSRRHVTTCEGNNLLRCQFTPKDQNHVVIRNCKNRVKLDYGCGGLSVVTISGILKSINVAGEEMQIRNKDDGPLRHAKEQTYAIKSDVFACKSWLMIAIVATFGLCIFLSIVLIITVSFLYYENKKKQRYFERVHADGTMDTTSILTKESADPSKIKT